MLTLTLTLVLSAANPPTVEAWADKACPRPKHEPESNVEFKAQEAARAECLQRAMNQALDQVIVPLKKKDRAEFKAWMALQADYNRWLAEACAVVEEAHWVDTATGERSMGTGYGSAEQQCRQRQYAWRGFYASAWARGDWKALTQAQEAYAQGASRSQEALRQYQEQVQAAAERAPVHTEPSDTPVHRLKKGEWMPYLARLKRAASAPRELAKHQCARRPKADPGCVEAFQATLLAQMDFSEVLGRRDGE